jgi:hypothetical protein
MKRHKIFQSLLLIFTFIVLTGCAERELVEPCLQGHTYGFWGGLLHGFIAPFDLIAMLFNDNVVVYADNTNGAWYAFGFLIGSGGWGMMGGKTLGGKKRH